MSPLPRRTLLALPALAAACAAPFPPPPEGAARDARALLDAAADAHGAAGLRTTRAIRVGYAGQWRPIVARLQPDLVDAPHRGTSEEDLVPAERLIDQRHTGPGGAKQVRRHMGDHTQGDVAVAFDGLPSQDLRARAAAALVADAYALFLLGPMLLAGAWTADRTLALALGDPAAIEVGGLTHDCDVLRVALRPGLGLSEADQLMLFIDRAERRMRRVRFSLEGLDSTRGAIAEVDTWGHLAAGGMRLPTRFHERLLRPAPLPVHDWAMTHVTVTV